MSRNFMEMLRARWAEGKFVCVGLDSEFGKIPKAAWKSSNEGGVGSTTLLLHSIARF